MVTNERLDYGIDAHGPLRRFVILSVATGTAAALLGATRFCFLNIPEKAKRDQAIREIIRVLKPGGQVAIYDIKRIFEYMQIFLESGMEKALLTSRLCWRLPF